MIIQTIYDFFSMSDSQFLDREAIDLHVVGWLRMKVRALKP
jgi:hypothetical protein